MPEDGSKALASEQGWCGGIRGACAPSHAWLRGKETFSLSPYSFARVGITYWKEKNKLGFPYTGCSTMPFREARRNPITDTGDGNSDLLKIFQAQQLFIFLAPMGEPFSLLPRKTAQ